MSSSFALFHNNKQVSKAHSTREAVYVEAIEQKAVIVWGSDFASDRPGMSLSDGYEIREVKDD